MNNLKIIGVAIAVLGVVLVMLTNFSATERKFACNGTLSTEDEAGAATLYIRMEQYRWWVELWSDSDAALHVELPNTHVAYFGDVVNVGDQYQIYSDIRMQGNFSMLSNALSLNMAAGTFDGQCKERG